MKRRYRLLLEPRRGSPTSSPIHSHQGVYRSQRQPSIGLYVSGQNPDALPRHPTPVEVRRIESAPITETRRPPSTHGPRHRCSVRSPGTTDKIQSCPRANTPKRGSSRRTSRRNQDTCNTPTMQQIKPMPGSWPTEVLSPSHSVLGRYETSRARSISYTPPRMPSPRPAFTPILTPTPTPTSSPTSIPSYLDPPPPYSILEPLSQDREVDTVESSARKWFERVKKCRVKINWRHYPKTIDVYY